MQYTAEQLTQRAMALNTVHSKPELVQQCRAAGWNGDPERFTYVIDVENIAKGKMALAYWLADHDLKRQNAFEEMKEAVKEAQQPKEETQQYREQQAAAYAAIAASTQTPKGQAMIPQNEKAAAIAALLASLSEPAPTVDAEQVREIVRAELSNVAPKVIQIKTEYETREMEGLQHPMFEKVTRLVAAGVNVLLTGSAGTGKTHLAESVAHALGKEYGAIHCTAGASESQLMGWLLPSDGGKFEYQAAPFVDLYERGNSLFLFDEMDAADPNFLLVANGALANGHIHVPQRRNAPTVARGEGVAIMATANTFGTGADMLYAGRNQLDAATLDRWYVVHIDYMAGLEAQVMGQQSEPAKAWQPAPTDEISIKADLSNLHAWLVNLRAKVTEQRLRRVISTRAFIKAATARAAGVPAKEIKKDLLAGWSADELRKIGEQA